MIPEVNTFSFVAESLGGVFDCLISLADAHALKYVCIREVSGFQVVHVTTNAGIDCVFDAVAAADDEVMLTSLRHLGQLEEVPG